MIKKINQMTKITFNGQSMQKKRKVNVYTYLLVSLFFNVIYIIFRYWNPFTYVYSIRLYFITYLILIIPLFLFNLIKDSKKIKYNCKYLLYSISFFIPNFFYENYYFIANNDFLSYVSIISIAFIACFIIKSIFNLEIILNEILEFSILFLFFVTRFLFQYPSVSYILQICAILLLLSYFIINLLSINNEINRVSFVVSAVFFIVFGFFIELIFKELFNYYSMILFVLFYSCLHALIIKKSNIKGIIKAIYVFWLVYIIVIFLINTLNIYNDYDFFNRSVNYYSVYYSIISLAILSSFKIIKLNVGK